jgi:hypothetical protein
MCHASPRVDNDHHNFAKAILSPSYNYRSTYLVQTLWRPYIDSANHHGESAQRQCCHSSTTLCLCLSNWHAQRLFLQSHSCGKQQDKRIKRTFQDHLFHFLWVLPAFSTFGHLDQASKHCPSQGYANQNRHPNSVSQRQSIDNFFQALYSIPFVLLSALFLPTWQAGECCSCSYHHWVIQDTPPPSQWLTTHYNGWYLPMPVSMPRPTS